MTFKYKSDPKDIDWHAFKNILNDDHFDNGRSPSQLKTSYENSAHTIFALEGSSIIGTARILSDGVCNAYLVDVWTHSKYRRQGIAKEMIHRLTTELQGQHIALFTDDQVAFYQHLGFDIEPTGMSEVQGQWLKK